MILVKKKFNWKKKNITLLFKNEKNEFFNYLMDPISAGEKDLKENREYELLFSKYDENKIIGILEK